VDRRALPAPRGGEHGGGVTRNPIIRTWLGDDDLIVDNFAGGGGVSEAFLRAIGRSPDHAINHDPEALAMHAANHPETEHHCESVWKIDPVAIADGRRVAAAWFSPDCKDHSSAKGGKPVDKKIRALAWSMVRWGAAVCPDVMFLENVPEFEQWGPCIEIDGEMRRDPKRKGQTFRKFVRRLERLGYVVEWRVMVACDYGSPTSRRRLFLVARRDGRLIVWPQPTHGPVGPALINLRPYRTAAECIDFSIPCPSIFMSEAEVRAYKDATGIRLKRPLVENTLERIAAGIQRFVFDDPEPFIVTLRGTSESHVRASAGSIHEPLRTISGEGWHHALVVPMLVQNGQGEREGQRPRWMDIRRPLTTVVAAGQRHALVQCAFVFNGNSQRETGGFNVGHALDRPMSAVTGQNQKGIVTVELADGDFDRHRAAQVAAFLLRYNGTSVGQSLREPLSTADTRDRFALVTVNVHGRSAVLSDVCYRLLEPPELFRAQDLANYRIDIDGPDGKPISRKAQIRMCGNAVPPGPAAALIAANLGEAA
jgi:DNA (cytosine-5)-methyltransferase 1